ncbi:trypsin-like serine peptidase [Kitasatospora acidiphila]|uniref:trypsin-like serine peptidase n=1 Tax=Kitasatospora acidiphila TaxID=2567942 RepID=UPI0015F01A70
MHSAAHDLILTAAHCVSSGASGVTFAPGYRDGKAPFGTWQVTKVFTTNGWSQTGDPDQDFAFLQLAPNSSGQQVEDVVGSENLGLNEPFTATVRLYGYPNASDEPIVCSNATTQQSAYQRRIDCPAYPNGTSGGPGSPPPPATSSASSAATSRAATPTTPRTAPTSTRRSGTCTARRQGRDRPVGCGRSPLRRRGTVRMPTPTGAIPPRFKRVHLQGLPSGVAVLSIA